MAAKKKAKVRPKTVAVEPVVAKPAKKKRKNIDVNKFIAVYSRTFDAGEAAKAAGSTAKNLRQAGYQILTNADVEAALLKVNSEAAERAGLSVEKTLREVARLAYSDIRKFYNEDGTLKKPCELDDDAAAVVAGFEADEIFDGTGKDRTWIGYAKKAKLFDKNSALEKAMKHHGLYEKDNDQINAVARAFLIPAKNRGGA